MVPAARSAAMRSRVACLAAGSMPAVGSSRTSSSGRPMSASASPSRCFSPPERRRYRVVAERARSTASRSASGSSGSRKKPGVQAQDLARRGPVVDAALLEHQPQPRPQRPPVPRRVEAQHPHGPAVDAAVPLEDLDRRGLARAVGPEEREQLAAANLERDVVEHLAAGVGLAEALDATTAGSADGDRAPSRPDLGVLGVEVLLADLADLDAPEDAVLVDEVRLRRAPRCARPWRAPRRGRPRWATRPRDRRGTPGPAPARPCTGRRSSRGRRWDPARRASPRTGGTPRGRARTTTPRS